MAVFQYVLLGILFSLLFVPFARLKVELQFNKNKPDDYLVLKIVSRFSFLSWEKVTSLKNLQKMMNSKVDLDAFNIERLENMVEGFYIYLRELERINKLLHKGNSLLSNTYWQRLELKLIYGTGDPALTGIAYGLLWAVLPALFLSYSESSCGQKKPDIRLIPDFQKKIFNLKADCIFHISVGHLIDVGTSLYYYKLKKRLLKALKRRR